MNRDVALTALGISSYHFVIEMSALQAFYFVGFRIRSCRCLRNEFLPDSTEKSQLPQLIFTASNFNRISSPQSLCFPTELQINFNYRDL